MSHQSPWRRYPELRDLAEQAQRAGATHVEYVGPAIGFYRVHHGRVERCFAEYAPRDKRYTWLWSPSDWRPGDDIPKGAVPISKFLSGR